MRYSLQHNVLLILTSFFRVNKPCISATMISSNGMDNSKVGQCNVQCSAVWLLEQTLGQGNWFQEVQSSCLVYVHNYSLIVYLDWSEIYFWNWTFKVFFSSENYFLVIKSFPFSIYAIIKIHFWNWIFKVFFFRKLYLGNKMIFFFHICQN